MIRAIAVLVLLGGTARAEPLEPLWEHKRACAGTYFAWGGMLIQQIDNTVVQIARDTGLPAATVTLSPPGGNSTWQNIASPTLVVADIAVFVAHHYWLAAVDHTGAERWRIDGLYGSEVQLAAVDADVLVARSIDESVTLERRDAATGAVRWRTPVQPALGPIEWVGHDRGRVYIATIPDATKPMLVAVAFDAATGKRSWRADVPMPRNDGHVIQWPRRVLAAAGGKLLAATGEGVRLIDGATGKATVIAMTDVWLFGDSTILTRGDRAYVARTAGITAIDLAAMTPAWTTAITPSALTAVTADAVFAGASGASMHALDLRTGAVIAQYGLAGINLLYSGGDPAMVGCADGRLFALGSAPPRLPPERATITGTLVCRRCGRPPGARPMAGITVSAGGVTTTTDARGAFQLAVVARGQLLLEFQLPALEGLSAWSEPSRIVNLRGRQRYALGPIGQRVLQRSPP